MTALGVPELRRAWAVLTRPSNNQLSAFPFELLLNNMPCRVALDRDGSRHLLIAVGDEHPVFDTRPSAICALMRPLDFGGVVSVYLDIACTERDLFPEFDEVVDDIVEVALRADSPAVAAADSLSRWRRLFRSRLVRGLSMDARIGLFAELSLITALAEADHMFPLEMWRGPLREPHDFEMQSRCVEVKGMAEGSDGFFVHGWEQLDRHDNRDLDLILMRVVRDPGGASISDLVGSLHGRVKSPVTLRSRLLSAGWDETVVENAGETYSIGAVFGVPVSNDVPRLVADSLVERQPPPGIRDIRYRVELSAILPYVVETSLPLLAERAMR